MKFKIVNFVHSIYFILFISVLYNIENINQGIAREQLNFDFIIPQPSLKQIIEIQDKAHISSVIPYYFDKFEISFGNNKVQSNGYVFKSNNGYKNTFFENNCNYSKDYNHLVIDSKLASALGVRLNTEVTINNISFKVGCVVRTTDLSVLGSFATSNPIIVSEYEEQTEPQGAFIKSSDYELSIKEIIDVYKPLGRFRTKLENETEEVYESYISFFNNSDYSNEIFFSKQILENRTLSNSRSIFYLYLSLYLTSLIYIVSFISITAIELKNYTKKIKKDISTSKTIKLIISETNNRTLSEIIMSLVIFILLTVISFYIYIMNYLTFKFLEMFILFLVFSFSVLIKILYINIYLRKFLSYEIKG
jgi:hypothetical protein